MAETISEIMSTMKERDIYSLMLSFLYDLRQVKEYTLLSELCYTLDQDSFYKFIDMFAGQTITVPTKEELTELIQVLRLFEYFEIEGRPWKESVQRAGLNSCEGKKATNKLNKLKETLKKYNFGNREY